MAFKHILTLNAQEDKYTLRIDGKIVKTTFGNTKDKPLEFLFLGIASLEDKIYNEGVRVSFSSSDGVNPDIIEYVKEACNRYQDLVQQKTFLEDVCRKTKANLNKLNNEIPGLY